MRIAAWSGPRNMSTAMMYAFAARADCAAVDEPFYAAFLAVTGIDHPMRDAVLAAQPTDPHAVAEDLARDGDPHRYFKLMTHHVMPDTPLGWAEGCAHLHLIRHPARVVASYEAKREAPTEADLGYAMQAALYDRLGGVVVDTTDLRRDPPSMLRALCDALGLPWDPAMTRWPAGPKPFDGGLGAALVRRRPSLHRLRGARGPAARGDARRSAARHLAVLPGPSEPGRSGQLALAEPRVEAALGDQRVVGAALDHPSGLHHQDLVGVPHRR